MEIQLYDKDVKLIAENKRQGGGEPYRSRSSARPQGRESPENNSRNQ